MKCVNCGYEGHPENATHCVKCGAQLVQPSTPASRPGKPCPGCGVLLAAPLPERCPNCRRALAVEDERARPATVVRQSLLARIPDRLVSLLGAAGGAVLTAVLVSALAGLARPGGFLERMFLPGGVLNTIPWAITFLFFWSIIVLTIRFSRLRVQQAFLESRIAADVERLLEADGAQAALDLLRRERVEGRSILLWRVQRALEQWRVSQTVEPVDSGLRHQAELDADVAASGYALVRIFVWAMPVLGLIGTVIGISLAVSGFSKFLGGEISNIEMVKKQLVGVTYGLSFAFLITLDGLMGALLVMLPTAGIQKAEEDFLAAVDRYCVDEIMPRLQSGAPVAPQAAISVDVSTRFEEALEKHLPTVTTWRAEVDAFTQAALLKIAEGSAEIGAKIFDTGEAETARLRDLAERIGTKFVEVGKQLAGQFAATQQRMAEETAKTVAAMGEQSANLREVLREHSARFEQTARHLVELSAQTQQLVSLQAATNASLEQLQTGDSLGKALTGVREALESLRPLLGRLSGPLELRLVAPEADSSSGRKPGH